MKKFDVADAIAFMTDTNVSFPDGEDRIKMLKNQGLVTSFGSLHLPKWSDEADRCAAIQGLLKDYAQRKSPPRPLSIAVFGPPGSGKSFSVKQLAESVNELLEFGGYESPNTINLSQVNDTRQLGQTLLEILALPGTDLTRVIFFDEFDARAQDEDLAWLKWFLAPMQDGSFFLDGKKFEIGKALFVFAGGTADRFERFQERYRKEEFIHKKVPDFVSRLRGILDIQGVNKADDERILRRTLMLHYHLGKLSKKLKGEKDTRKIDKRLLSDMLSRMHYIHGARSIEALLEMSSLTGANKLQPKHLPEEQLRRLHARLGTLDELTIGISAGNEDPSKRFFEKFAKTVLTQRGTLAYGGDLWAGTLKTIVRVAIKMPRELPELVTTDRKPIRNLLAYPNFLKPEFQDSKKSVPNAEKYVDFVELPTLSDEEKQRLVRPHDPGKWFTNSLPGHHAAWALSLFRMRLRLAQEIDFLVVVGGRDDGQSYGRFPGIAEEVMLALAFEKPIYLLGIAGGAAKAVGSLMGLGETHEGAPRCLKEPPDPNPDHHAFISTIAKLADSFDVPYLPNLPTTIVELKKFLAARAPGTDQWPDNGLTLAENRELVNCPDDDEGLARCIALIEQGITRLTWG